MKPGIPVLRYAFFFDYLLTILRLTITTGFPIMFWLYLLGTVTILSIALRRVVARENALHDQLFSKTVAFEHAQNGMAWVQSDGTVESMNASLASTLGVEPKDVRGTNWC